jgi:Protein of unknown function (DUF1460).
MKTLLLVLSGFCFLASAHAQKQDEIAQIETILSQGETLSIIDVALTFVDSPYGSLPEGEGEEQLLIDIESFDCVTLVETCLALSRTAHLYIDPTYEDFANELQLIRYRGGIIDDYPSRLHYMTDWVYDNEELGIVEDITCEIGGKPLAPGLNYMSQHPDLYPSLKGSKENIDQIKEAEDAINRRDDYYCFLPKHRIDRMSESIEDGDIIFFVTSTPGLDVQHAGIAYWKENGQLSFIHASSRAKKVIVEPLSMFDYCRNGKSITGIMVVRLE